MKDKAACHRHQVKPYRLYVPFTVIFKGMALLRVSREIILLHILLPSKAREKVSRDARRTGQWRWFVLLTLQMFIFCCARASDWGRFGGKKIAVPDVEMLQDEFWSLIAGYFPKLEGCGGFELLRCVANSRCLEVILPKIWRSPKLLGAIAGTSKTYICPTQQDLDLEPNVSESSFTEVFICIVCHSAVICMCTYMYMHVMDILSWNLNATALLDSFQSLNRSFDSTWYHTWCSTCSSALQLITIERHPYTAGLWYTVS